MFVGVATWLLGRIPNLYYTTNCRPIAIPVGEGVSALGQDYRIVYGCACENSENGRVLQFFFENGNLFLEREKVKRACHAQLVFHGGLTGHQWDESGGRVDSPLLRSLTDFIHPLPTA